MPLFDLSLDQLHEYRPDRAEPEDFRSFWDTTLAEARSHPLELTLADHDLHLPLVAALDPSFNGFGGQRVRGWLLRPRALAGDAPAVAPPGPPATRPAPTPRTSRGSSPAGCWTRTTTTTAGCSPMPCAPSRWRTPSTGSTAAAWRSTAAARAARSASPPRPWPTASPPPWSTSPSSRTSHAPSTSPTAGRMPSCWVSCARAATGWPRPSPRSATSTG